jgi:putative toxin-antitoxin system antitoxin component (TIGR02293 family)
MKNSGAVRKTALLKLATEVLESHSAAHQWLSTPKKALGGKIPNESTKTALGVAEIKMLLSRIEHGVFS